MADDAIAHTPGSYGGAMGDGTRAPRWWYVAMGVVAAGALGMAVLLVVVELERLVARQPAAPVPGVGGRVLGHRGSS